MRERETERERERERERVMGKYLLLLAVSSSRSQTWWCVPGDGEVSGSEVVVSVGAAAAVKLPVGTAQDLDR